MRATLIQFDARGEPKGDALARALSLVEQAPPCDLMLLPELWTSGAFSCGRFTADAEDLAGPTVTAFCDRARARKTGILIGSLVECSGGKLYNTSVLIDAGGQVLARYRKMHLFGQAGSLEPKYLTRGGEVVVVDTPWGRAGLSTCYDLRFPELYRRQMEQGAELFLVCAGWPKARIAAWNLFVRARAAENQAVMLACNGTGTTDGIELGGFSQIVDPLGEVLARAENGERMLTADWNPDSIAKVRSSFSALRDRVIQTAG